MKSIRQFDLPHPLRLKHLPLGLGLLLLAWSLVSAGCIATYAKVSNEQAADSIIVLGAAAWGDRPSPVFRERIKHALNLYQAGYAPLLIFTGGRGDDDALAEAEVARHYAIQHGIPPHVILVETVSKTTAQNLYQAQHLLKTHTLTSAIIVSDPLHMKRAMTLAADLGLVAYSSPTPSTRYQSWRTQLKFLLRETYFYQRYMVY